MLSAAGLTQFEKDRLRRIAENKKRLDALLEGVDTSLIKQQPTKHNRAKAPPKKRQKVVPSEADIRRSSRISSKPAPLYFIEEDATQSRGRSRRMSTGGGRAPHGERCHGLRLTAAGGSGADDLYLAAPKGWKPELGCASIQAAEAATNAALAKQAELAAAGRSSFVKLMSASQVSSGFWMQLPLDIVQFYKGSQRVISLYCLDKQHQPPDSFQYANRGSSSSWPVVFLPKGGEDSAGLSGGWRGFAIDQRLHPNDTLLFEVVDEPPLGSSCRDGGSSGSGDGAAAADVAEQAADAGGGGRGDGGSTSAAAAAVDTGRLSAAAAGAAAPVAPNKRAHLLAHIFRAYSYEDQSQQQQAESCADSQQAEGRDGSQAALGSEESGGEEEEDGGEGDDDTRAAAGGKDQDKQQKQGRQQRRLAVAQQQAALQPKQQQQQQQQAGGRSEAELLQAAAAGQLRGLKIATLQQRTTAASCAPTARAPAGSGGRGGGTKKRQQQPAAALPPPPAAAAADQGPSGAARQASGRVRRAKRFHDGSEAGGPGGSAGGGGARALVPKPACPGELVAPPSEAEVARDAAGGPFYVKQILAHRVSASGGDEFLVSWAGFGGWWDSWEPAGSLDAPPGSYSWRGGRAGVPAKFKNV